MITLFENAQCYVNERETAVLHILTDTASGTIINISDVPLENHDADEIIDVKGKLLIPGLVDLHVHLREPGGEKKETIKTGTLAAARGGFTTVAAMPNTRPVPDTVDNFTMIYSKMKEEGHVRVLPYAAITERQAGRDLTDMEKLASLNAFAFTDDGVGVQEAGTMFEAMTKAASLGKAVVAHCEDNSLLYGGAVHEGSFSKKASLPGILSVTESVHIARDVLLAEATGCHYHVCHVSTKESVRVIRDAKKAGIHVTAEVTPHHLILSENDIPGDDANFKMNPPLRSEEDRQALVAGLLDGTIDFIATDHAPHTDEEKKLSMIEAPFGIVGLEIAYPLLYTELVKKQQLISEKQLIDWLTIKPAKAFNLPYGKVKEGGVADFTVIDRELTSEVNPNSFFSKGKNTPFTGKSLESWPIMTVYGGRVIWHEGKKEVMT
ncbi:dihydroorotase [Salipaludibacillus agaradhaerens]|uniref:Dihydroorotase n=1 Tax=Salipaludibacillus agaradhaerens TaxID=76935 RepID=A0A9Q4B0B1_SALAG|nr:dihydroorotase [Salipaludibacillus agaradhaerens]MCR6095969.1 dihydroorotase [Salipaludibacillus agaradhaerens]MCR6114472.1 dihydroorotase [Salipaludibacillus agaradhaerens]